jgi:hypothetical protein
MHVLVPLPQSTRRSVHANVRAISLLCLTFLHKAGYCFNAAAALELLLCSWESQSSVRIC